uniref:Chemerin chemokine-like receptor 1 n=1 Tax=Amphilophus citrinellus TaxID=61819 RepID=A0A3Q0SLL6_AMPCI
GDWLDYLTYNGQSNSTLYEEVVLQHNSMCEGFCVALVVVNMTIFLLGFCGNALVIWIAGFKMNKTVNTIWYLSLAISDLMFCAFIPITVAYTVTEEWIFGRFLCKLVPSLMFLNMFSSIFLLVIISIDRCVSVIFPVWAQNQRTVKKASVVVFLAWFLAIALSVPSMLSRDVVSHLGRTICFNNYTVQHSHKTVALSRFLASFVIPFFIITICYAIIILKLRTNRMAKNTKPFKVMTALIVAFFICWLPYHVFILLELNIHHHGYSIVYIGLKVGTSMAAANSFLNPVLYVFMGNDFRRKFKSTLLSKMENAMGDEGRTTSRYLSRSSSMDGRASTHI